MKMIMNIKINYVSKIFIFFIVCLNFYEISTMENDKKNSKINVLPKINDLPCYGITIAGAIDFYKQLTSNFEIDQGEKDEDENERMDNILSSMPNQIKMM